MDKLKLLETLEKYLGHEHEYGSYCCNLAFLEYFEPTYYEKLVGRYSTAIGGARVAKKEIGYSSVEQILEDKYLEIPFDFVRFGDVIVKGVSVAICLGDRTFTMLENKFTTVNTEALRGYRCFREV